MVDAFEFLFEDRLASEAEVTLEEKIEKLRSDLTFMWRSKLFSDVKLVLGEDADDDVDENDEGSGRRHSRVPTKMVDIPDANMSVLSLAMTVQTQVDESDAEDDELTSFSTHRMILASRSQYFASMLLSPYADAKAPVLHLPSPPFTPASLHFTLGFLYTGTLFFSNRTFDLSTAFSLWRAGAYLQIETLQNLVVALIDREFCHGFVCSPPCRKCVKRVPRTLHFATSPDVSEPALQEPAIAAVSGTHFGMYWAKDVGNLDPAIQDRIVDNISTRLTHDPAEIVLVLRQLSIVGQRIDTERSSRWVESLRVMAETVETRFVPLLHANLERIVQSQPWSDLLDGVGSLGDVLEKALVMLIDGLTEAKAAQVYQTLVGQVLLREQGFEVAQSRHAVENARTSILRYLKKRWINVRALAGFNKLEKWCLKELADELDVTTTDLVLPEEGQMRMPKPPSRLMGTRPPAPAIIVSRRTSSIGAGSGLARAPSSAGVGPGSAGRLGTTSNSSITRTASRARKAEQKEEPAEGEREAGPINMRAAVLNRNAARTSVLNGHRSLSSASTASATSPTARAKAPVSASPTTAPPAAAGSSAALQRTTTTTTTVLRLRAVVPNGSPAATRTTPPGTNAAGTTAKPRTRTESGASVASARMANSRQATPPRTTATSAASSRSSPTTPLLAKSTSSGTAAKPRSSPSKAKLSSDATLTAPDTDKTPTKSVRTVRSNASLSVPGVSMPPAASSSVDSLTAKAKPQPPKLGHKSSFLRATPGPGGTFSLSTTDSGRDLRARTLSSSSASKKSSASLSSVDKAAATVKGMPADALENIRKASTNAMFPRAESTQTIVYKPGDQEEERAAGISLKVGIACIVSLSLPASSLPAGGKVVRRSASGKLLTSPAKPGTSTTVLVKKIRLQAVVRYLGPVGERKGVWVGVQLRPSPALLAALEKSKLMRLKHGCFDGVRYFDDESAKQEKDKEEGWRLERRKELWQALSPEAPFPQVANDKAPAGGGGGGGEVVELFVRPSDVVWVVQQ